MPSFSTRIELHSATREDYTKLHEKMRAAGFQTTITGGDSKTYHLPPAEYRSSEAYGTTETVRDRAALIASSVKANPAVFVTEGANCAWTGLSEVAPARAW